MNWPTISCLMVTHDRPEFVADSIRQFQAQDYPGGREFVVLDNGTRSVAALCEGLPQVRYLRVEPGKFALGTLRNRAHASSTGDIAIDWDDDDYHAPGYATALVQALQATPAVHWSTLRGPTVVQFMGSGECLLWEQSFLFDGCLATWKRHWEPFTEGASKGERTRFMQDKLDGRPRHPGTSIVRPDLFVYRVHGANVWADRTKMKRLTPLPAALREALGTALTDCPSLTPVVTQPLRAPVRLHGEPVRPRLRVHTHVRRVGG